MSYRAALTRRLIEIPFRLVNGFCSRQQLAREFGVDAKTISRDIDALGREYPIVSRREGREVYYGFSDDFKFKFPTLSTQELGVLLLAQEAIAGVGMTARESPFAGHADSLLKKIRKALPASIIERMDALAAVYGSSSVPAKNFSKHTEIIYQLANCAVNRKKAQIRYHALGSNEEKPRTLEPYAVYFDPDGATLKLVGFDNGYKAIRVFSVERIVHFKELNEKFSRPKDFNLKTYLDENCFNGIHGEPVTVRLRATGVTARIFAERVFHPTQKIIKRKQRRADLPETITIEMRVARGRGLVRFILSWLPDVKVLSPKELREEVRQVLAGGLENFK